MKYKTFCAALLCAALLAGCAQQSVQTEEAGSGSGAVEKTIVSAVPEEALERFGGCSLLSLPGNLVAAAATGKSYKEAAAITDFSLSSDEAWQKLLDDELDLVLAYEPDDATLQSLQEAGVTMQTVGTDALVVLAGGDTQETRSLTCEQLRTAFETGATEEWTCYAAKPGTTSRMLATRLFGEEFAGTAAQADGEALTASCPHTAGTLCYTTYLRTLENGLPEGTSLIAADGILPDAQSVLQADSSVQYPLRAQYIIACRGGLEENNPAMLVYRWLTGEKGTQWLEQTLAANAGSSDS